MVKLTRAAWLLTAILTVGMVTILGPALDAEAAAKPAPGPKMNPAVLKPLQAAMELINGGKFAEAEVELQKADAVPGKTPFEQFQIDELVGFTSLKQSK